MFNELIIAADFSYDDDDCAELSCPPEGGVQVEEEDEAGGRRNG